MNCLNCGAPLELDEGRGVLSCRYCSSARELSLPNNDPDRVVPLDQPAGMNCPLCYIELVEAAIDGKQAKYCTGCRGILFDSHVFAEVARKRRAMYRGSEIVPRLIDPEVFERLIDCPNCENPMEVHPHYGAGRAVIDSCHRCHLVWLDYFELTSIERTPGLRSCH